MPYVKPNIYCYRFTQAAAWLVSSLIFRRKFKRNEIKDKKGPFVVIANHQTKLDFVNLITASARPMTFVISKSFYNTLPIKGFLGKLGVIPKQQFQTTVRDMRAIKSVIDSGEALVIYPAGLMCEDGISTPIPAATYKFLKWLGADVYAARCSGTYFVMPKWSKGMRPGRTFMDIYKLFSKEELAELDVEAIKERTDSALLFDAYHEQAQLKVKYAGGRNIEGLENVLYTCPDCGAEFSIEAVNGNTLSCRKCGYKQVSDGYSLMSRSSENGPELRYASDWSRLVLDTLRKRMKQGEDCVLEEDAEIHMIDIDKKKFVPSGRCMVTLSEKGFALKGQINGEAAYMEIPITNIPTLPFGPGKYFEIQSGENILRCYPEDGRLVMKYINMIKIFYEINKETK